MRTAIAGGPRLGGALSTLRLLLRQPAGLVGLLGVVALTLLSFVGPLLVPPANQADLGAIYQAPSAAHPLGSDFQGRDNLVMLIHGGRDVILLAVATGLLTTLIAVAVGAFSALLGGAFDSALMGLTDIWLTIPRFILLVVLASLIRLESVWALAALLAVFGWPGLARQIRAQILSLKQREYVEAAQLLGLGVAHIVFREMLPNMLSFIVIALIAAMTQAIYTQTGLVFLGVVPFGNNWGVLFSLAYAKNAIYLPAASWSLLAPMGAIILFQLSLVLLTRGLEEVFNPRLRSDL
jgi:peptide/nickel transport system permease protein